MLILVSAQSAKMSSILMYDFEKLKDMLESKETEKLMVRYLKL